MLNRILAFILIRRVINKYNCIFLSKSGPLILGDVILSTPSLDSYRVNQDPLYRYDGNLSTRLSTEVDHRLLSYDRLENRRYQTLRMRPPTQSYINRIYDERCMMFLPIRISQSNILFEFLVGPVVTPRVEPSRTIRIQTAPGYRLLINRIPNQDQTMVPQRFNKLSPFVTEQVHNPNTNSILQEST